KGLRRHRELLMPKTQEHAIGEDRCLRGHTESIHTVSFAPCGQRAASGGVDGTIRLWDVRTSGETACLYGHRDWVNGVSFSPDGLRILSGSADGTVRLWDAATARELRCFEGGMGYISSV